MARLIAGAAFTTFLFFGVWWIALEVMRWRQEQRLNQDYEEEVAAREAVIRRMQEWENTLAAKQAEARRQYEKELGRWNQAVAAQIDARQRQEQEWEDRLAAEQAQARQRYDKELERWNQIVAEQEMAVRRQKQEWEDWLAAEQAPARQQYEKELGRWNQAVAAQIDARQRQKQEWEDRLAAEQAQARQRYDKELERWNQIVAERQTIAIRQRQEWESKLAAEQARAEQQYEEKLRPWSQAVTAIRAEADKRVKANADAELRLRAAEANWFTRASSYGNRFQMKKAELRAMRERHEILSREYTAEKQRLQPKAREIQFIQFLQQQFIENADIADIGSTRKATLASFGIETAYDVEETAILDVPGFGPKLTQRLIRWRQEIEIQFVFNPSVGVLPQDQQALDSKFARIQQPIEEALLAGEGELKAIVKQAEGELHQLYAHILSCLQSFVQAQLDLKVLPPAI